MNNKIIAVDLYGNPIGEYTKEEGHVRPILHRAFSVFLYSHDQMLIQQRAMNKYHSAGLWANSCCSHPQPGEDLHLAVERRLQEELNLQCSCKEVFSFVYFHKFSDNLFEYEYDHVFVGEYDGEVQFNTDEVAQVKWVPINELASDLVAFPEKYSIWFLLSAPKVIEIIVNASKNK